MQDAFTKALREWSELLGTERVLSGRAATIRYGASTLENGTRPIKGALHVRSAQEIAPILQIASANSISVYPISIGHNWGYGSATPTIDTVVVLDLSEMKKISIPDKDLGLVTVEPGVTVGELQQFLLDNAIPFLPPLTGAGPATSVIGNMLERGRSGTAPVDRFASLTALEVVLPNGEIYRSPLVNNDESMSNAHFKWGIGPYVDGLFAQSNFGIVTKATFALARKPDYCEVFFIVTKEMATPGDIANASREVLQRIPGIVPALKIQGPTRTFTRLEQYPKNHVSPGEVLDQHLIRSYLKRQGLSQWVVFGSLQGPKNVVRAARQTIRDIYRKHASHVSFFSSDVQLFWRIAKKLFPRWLRGRLMYLTMVLSYLNASQGKSGSVNPKLPVWRKTGNFSASEMGAFLDQSVNYDLDPECGFILFGAILPMRKSNVDSFLEIANEVFAQHHIETLINFINFSDRSLFVSCPLIFNKSSEEETQRAHKCYEELFRRVQKAGARLHRTTARHMHLIVEKDKSFWKIVQKIKNALDPNDIVSPGRYSSTKLK